MCVTGTTFRAIFAGCAAILLSGAPLLACRTNPERSLEGCWKQVDSRYEKVDVDDNGDPVGPAVGRWNDGVRSREYPDRRVVRHDSEYWRFSSGGDVAIAAQDGGVSHGRWRLKGRGHVLTLRFPPGDGFEVYNIEELDEHELVLHYDVGVEARGIARLTFHRVASGDDSISACIPAHGAAS